MPIPMTAVDGAFNSTVEAVTASLGTVGLADGSHTVYIRGRDSAGYWGTVRAAWVWVLDPSTAGHIEGVVTEAETGLPLQATVSAGVFSTESGPASGSYDLLVPPGTHDVTAVADGFGPITAVGVTAISGATTNRDFALYPFETIAEDDVEGGSTGWTVQGQWAITTEASASPTHSWTDSPGGYYGDNWNFSLTSPGFDFSDRSGIILEFSHIYDLESGWDYGHVEVSGNGGASWSTVASYSGIQTGPWERIEIPAPQLDQSADARIRFRIYTDTNTTRDGWHIDDLVIRGFYDAPPGLLFQNGFESGDTSSWAVTSP